MISPKKVKYNEFMSTDFPTFTLLTDLAFDSDNGEVSSYLTREAVASESYHGEFKRVHSYKYTESLSLKLTFIKEGFTDFSLDETRKVLTWLTAKKTASFLDVYDDIYSETVMYSVLGGFTDIQLYKISNNRTVAIVATFESVNPWALSPIISTGEITVAEPKELKINCETDELESLVYPRITIRVKGIVVQADTDLGEQFGTSNAAPSDYVPGTVYKYSEDGDADHYYWVDAEGTLHDQGTNGSDFATTSTVIYNTTTDTKTIIGRNVASDTVIIDGANKVISRVREGAQVIGDDFNWKWLPLQAGENVIKIMGNCTVQFDWREPRKVGEW